ncbi:hypothetical protein OAO91_05705 [Luminiphilus sp.]|nr:hypothetical protein [Luminiphilus sp.]
MKKLIAPILAFGLFLSGCELDQAAEYIELAEETYEESVIVTSVYMEEMTSKWRDRPVELCEMTDSEMFDFIGGLTSGTALTGWLAGDSIIALATSMGTVAVVMPAVATGIVVGAASASAAYAGVKGYCAGV